MSNEALRLLRKVWIPGPAKAVAIVLADHANDASWSCFVSQVTIAFEAGLSRRTVQRALQALCADGLISIEERFGSQYGRASNITRLIRSAWNERATGRKDPSPAVIARVLGAGSGGSATPRVTRTPASQRRTKAAT